MQFAVLVLVDDEADRSLQRLDVGRIEVYVHRLVLVEQVVLDTSFESVDRVELQLLHSLCSERCRLQNLHLVVDTLTVCHYTQCRRVGDVASAASASAVVVVLDEQLGVRLVHRCRVAQLDGSYAQTDD